MSDTEDMQRTPSQHREAIRAEIRANMPAGVDAQGRSENDRAASAATVARITAPEPVADPEPHAMRPNRAQGSSGATVPTPTPTDPLAAIRAKVRTTL